MGMAIFGTEALKPVELEVLKHMWNNGPIWDGNLVSKQARDRLVDLHFADRCQGFNFLTKAGVELCATLGWHREKM